VNYLVTGTDTGVGKTFLTSGLVRYSRSKGIDSVGMKPIWYRTPVAPYTASIIEDRLIDLNAIREAFEQLAKKHSSVLVEGVGGIAVPISAHYDFRDLARVLRLNVILVAANRLGVLNHARLTLEAIRASGLPCSLIALNSVHPDSDVSQTTNLSILENLLDVPVVAVEHGQQEFEVLARYLW
jgi:dethiobiotin synthetase